MHLVVGKRISLGSHRGTIRYVGPVPPSSGEWLGVEWDDSSRGKHDGTSGGTRYFTVRIPGSGSFIRPTASKLCSGCSFVEALRNKYAPPRLPVQEHAQQSYSRKTIADIEIETPNLDRISRRAARLDRLRDVGLGGWQSGSSVEEQTAEEQYSVARAFDPDKGFPQGVIRSTCPNLRWLDLSRSLLPDWEEVSLITGELDHLQTLLLHCNRLQPPPQPLPPSWADRLGHIHDLRLDATFIQWDDILKLAPALTGLKHLQLGGNGITALVSPSAGAQSAVLPALTSLSLEENELASWADIASALAQLPCLESLNLNRNRVASIPPASTSAKLPKLKELFLRGNQLDTWTSLENIPPWLANDQLEALHIFDMDETASANVGLLARYEYRDFRAVAIARLGSLAVLDKTPITPKERKDAELFVYTRFRQGDASIIEGAPAHPGQSATLVLSTPDNVARFPRFAQLAQQFDADTDIPARPARESTTTLRSNMLSVMVIASPSAPAQCQPHVAQPHASAAVRLLATTPLRIAKTKLAAAVRVRADQVDQVWALLSPPNAPQGADKIVLEIDDLSRSLDWYQVASDDQIVLVIP